MKSRSGNVPGPQWGKAPMAMLWVSGYFQAAALPPAEAEEEVINQRNTCTYVHTHWFMHFMLPAENMPAYLKTCKQTGHWPHLLSSSLSGHQMDLYWEAAAENSHCCPIAGHGIVHMGLM